MRRPVRRRHAVALEEVEAAGLPPRVEADCLVRAALERPGRREEGILVEVAVVLAPMLEEFSRRGDRQVVGAFLELAVTSGPGREVESRRPAPDEDRSLDVGIDVTCEPALRRSSYVAVDAGLFGQDDVKYLALAREVGAIKIARADLDADHALCWNARKGRVDRLGLAAVAGPIDDHVPGGSGEAAHVLRTAKIESESGHVPCDVERGARSKLREERCFIDCSPVHAGL